VIAALPNGLDTALGDNGYRLSGGQRQRLALARAWLRDCPIVVLDEVLQGLDTATARRLRQKLTQWGAQRTMLTITHSLQHLQQMDQIYVLQQGEVVEQGTIQELLAKQDGMFYQMWQLERQQIGVAV
jgi:ATP-binding cassette subfamily C protein CydC